MEPTNVQNDPKKVLVIEDDKLLRELLAGKLTKEGFEVKSTNDAKSAFSAMSQDKPDIILLDLILPGVDGFDILSGIKADMSMTDVPVVILSNLGQQEDVDRALALGAYDFLVKANYTLEEIVARVREILA